MFDFVFMYLLFQVLSGSAILFASVVVGLSNCFGFSLTSLLINTGIIRGMLVYWLHVGH